MFCQKQSSRSVFAAGSDASAIVFIQARWNEADQDWDFYVSQRLNLLVRPISDDVPQGFVWAYKLLHEVAAGRQLSDFVSHIVSA